MCHKPYIFICFEIKIVKLVISVKKLYPDELRQEFQKIAISFCTEMLFQQV